MTVDPTARTRDKSFSVRRLIFRKLPADAYGMTCKNLFSSTLDYTSEHEIVTTVIFNSAEIQ